MPGIRSLHFGRLGEDTVFSAEGCLDKRLTEDYLIYLLQLRQCELFRHEIQCNIGILHLSP